MWTVGAHGSGLLGGSGRSVSSRSRGVQSRGLGGVAHRERSRRLLRSCRLRSQRLLRHQWSPPRVTHSPRVRERSLRLAGHPHWLLGHVWERGLPRVGVVLRGQMDHVRLRGWRQLWVQGGANGLTAGGGHVVLRHWRHWLTAGGHLGAGTSRDLHPWVGGDLRGTGGLLWQHVLVGESRGHLLVGVGQVGLRYRRCWLRGGGYVRVYSLGGAWHHVGVLLWGVAPRRLVILGNLRLIAILLMRLQLTWEWLLVLGGHVSMGEGRLSLEVRGGARNSPRSRLVALRQHLPDGLRVRLRLLWLLRMGGGSLCWALNGHELGVGPHLGGDNVAR